MNTNLKIALLLGYSFTRHGWNYCEEHGGTEFKVWDNTDYEFFDFNNLNHLVSAVNTIERKYGIEFEFSRAKGIFQMVDVFGKSVPNLEQITGTTLTELFHQAIEATFPNEVSEQMEEIQKNYSWHYHGILHTKEV